MVLLFAGLVFSLVVMLSFTAIFYRLSPYNGSVAEYRFHKWEKAILYFMLVYPACSLLLLFLPGSTWDQLLQDAHLYRKAYLLFTGVHIFLAATAAIVSHSLRKQGNWYRVLLVLNIATAVFYSIAYFELYGLCI